MLQVNDIKGNKVQICNPGMPKSFYIEKEDYKLIYPNERVPRRIAITFNSLTKTVWLDPKLAEFIIAKYPHIYYHNKEKPEVKVHVKPIPVIDEAKLAEIEAQKQRYLKLDLKGWNKLSASQKIEYRALKEALFGKKKKKPPKDNTRGVS